MRLSSDAVLPLDDLGWLGEAVGDARVVAIGESSHFTREFYELRLNLLRHLGIDAYAMESGFPEGWTTHDRLAGGEGPAAQGITSLMGVWTEMRDQLDWMRANGTRFYGIDLPGSNCSLTPGVDAVTAYLAEADPDYTVPPAVRAAAAWSAASPFSAPQALAAYTELEPAQRDALTAGLAGLTARLRARRLDYIERTGADAYSRTLHTLSLTVTLDATVREMAGGGTQHLSIRDAGIADTIEWILGREQRLVVGAHNMHVQRSPMIMPGMPVSTPMGMHLAERLRDDYVVIGTTSGPGQTLNNGPGFYSGELFTDLEAPDPDSLDGLMAATHDGPFAVDLRRLSADDAKAVQAAARHRIGAWYAEVEPLAAFDILVHIPRVTAAHPDEAALAHAPAEVAEVFAAYLRK
ncbi:erythromycin esterase family protein [Nonomuraea typhae]|uniref:Erythromycin esterase family protein n=1 Tax=Nonomuraea typhae TaxID=2603600 RepID=A0ABW7YVY8_9ACTN